MVTSVLLSVLAFALLGSGWLAALSVRDQIPILLPFILLIVGNLVALASLTLSAMTFISSRFRDGDSG